jgi:folate-binding protein YgfZ
LFDLAYLRACLADAVQSPLPPVESVIVSGPDARRFLNGMFTSDVQALAVGGGHRSALLDDRGRMVGLVDVYCLEADKFLVVPEGMTAAAFTARYEPFVIADDVTMEPGPAGVALTIQGGRAESALREAGLPIPTGGWLHHYGLWILRRDRTGAGGFDLVVGNSGATIPMIARMFPPPAIEVLRVAAGRPRWPLDMGDKRLVHEVNLRDDVLAFGKGCYIGQETVNRVDVMGEVKRVLVGISIRGAAAVPTGASVQVDGVEVGVLTSPVEVSDGTIGLLVAKKPANQPGTIAEVVSGERRWPAKIEPLPFP